MVIFDVMSNSDIARMTSKRVSEVGFADTPSYRRNIHLALDRFYTDGKLSAKQRQLMISYLNKTNIKVELI